jgi:hypothetical protein
MERELGLRGFGVGVGGVPKFLEMILRDGIGSSRILGARDTDTFFMSWDFGSKDNDILEWPFIELDLVICLGHVCLFSFTVRDSKQLNLR